TGTRGMLKLYELMQGLGEADLPAALELAEKQAKGQQLYVLREALLSRLAEFDGERAMEYALESISVNMRTMSVSSVILKWGESDPEAVFEWFERNEENEALNASFLHGKYYLSSVFLGLGQQDFETAFEKLDTLES